MFFVNFIATLLIIYIGVRVVWFLFGRQLAVMAVRRMARKMEEALLRQQTAQANARGGTEQEIFVDREVKIRVPKPSPNPTKPTNLSQMAEDVDFEDVRGTD
jgi:hypothetical protein